MKYTKQMVDAFQSTSYIVVSSVTVRKRTSVHIPVDARQIFLSATTGKDDNNINDDETVIRDYDGIGDIYQNQQERDNTSSPSSITNEVKDVEFMNRVTTNERSTRNKRKKFTGKPASSSSSLLFTSSTTQQMTKKEGNDKEASMSNRNLGNSSNPVSPYKREMDLASQFERTLPIQALSLLVAICFVTYIGFFSNEITDGSDRDFNGQDDIEETMLPSFWEEQKRLLQQEQQQPSPRVSENSVYL